MNKEFSIIDKYFKPLTLHPQDCENDVFTLESTNNTIVVSKDILVEGSHFLVNTTPKLIAKRALRANLSDIASSGAKPLSFALGLSVPRNTPEDWFKDFALGLSEDSDHFDIKLRGGDTTSNLSELIFISITIFGALLQNQEPLSRCDAQPGDKIFISGEIGSSFLGLQLKKNKIDPKTTLEADHFIQRFDLPEPRVDLGLALSNIASSCIDVSDGLIQDLGHLVNLSKLDAYIDSAKVPLHPMARRLVAQKICTFQQLITGGEDFELLFSASNLPQSIKEKYNIAEIGYFQTTNNISQPTIYLDQQKINIQDFKGYEHL